MCHRVCERRNIGLHPHTAQGGLRPSASWNATDAFKKSTDTYTLLTQLPALAFQLCDLRKSTKKTVTVSQLFFLFLSKIYQHER
jgi:hypothetical protein